jgi:hypothetical protein
MSLSVSEKAALDALLAKGDITGAHNLLAGKVGAATVEPAAAPEPSPPPPPRDPTEVLTDILQAIYNLLGSSPALGPLLNEWKDVTKPAKPAAE